MDALLIKEMNMNAVRSHYPPDEHFLDMCDSLGLVYMDELAGWQNGRTFLKDKDKIINALELPYSNAKLEATNNLIKVIILRHTALFTR